MFEQSLMDLASTERKSPWAIGLSLLLQLAMIGVMILVPLIFTETLSGGKLTTFLVAPAPPPPPGPARTVRHIVSEIQDDGRLKAPREVPKEIAVITEESAPSADTVAPPGGVPGGVPGGKPGGIPGGIPETPAPPPPPPPPPPAKPAEQPKRIMVGGDVQSARCAKVNPIYPQLARQARIQGVVRLEAIIDESGRVTSVKVISGHPLLVQAALDAVRQWHCTPTMLNNKPVEVQTTIDVNFTLSQ